MHTYKTKLILELIFMIQVQHPKMMHTYKTKWIYTTKIYDTQKIQKLKQIHTKLSEIMMLRVLIDDLYKSSKKAPPIVYFATLATTKEQIKMIIQTLYNL